MSDDLLKYLPDDGWHSVAKKGDSIYVDGAKVSSEADVTGDGVPFYAFGVSEEEKTKIMDQIREHDKTSVGHISHVAVTDERMVKLFSRWLSD